MQISLTLTLLASAAMAQQPKEQPTPQNARTFASAADVEALIAKAMRERKPDQPILSQDLLPITPGRMNVEYRAAVGPAALHAREAEIFYVLDGAATMVTGGTLVNATETRAEQFQGTKVEGGASRSIAKGDFIIVPENTPHWFSAIDGRLVLMTLKVPRGIAPKR